jgi:hypothetical protein
MTIYLSTTFSPMMLRERVSGYVREITLAQAKKILQDPFVSAVGHEVTAEVLSALLGRKIEFNRINWSSRAGTNLSALSLSSVPNRRGSSAGMKWKQRATVASKCSLLDRVLNALVGGGPGGPPPT